jgi:hypothetical protein
MARVQAFEIEGLKLWFWSNDHDPPHFHAKKDGEWEVRVRFLLRRGDMVEVKWEKKSVPSKTLKNLEALAETHRAALLAQWEEINGT